jgi:Reverse transcriptase (RNA-dependent DNA polymerase).
MNNQRRNKTEHQVHTWRITIGNINSFPNDPNGMSKFKIDKLRQLVVNNQSDIVLMSEHNRNLTNLDFHHQPSTVMKKWWSNTIVRTAFLASTSKARYEPGGTMIVTNSRATAHTCLTGEDMQQLGRWNYITLRGKNNYYTTIISVYRLSRYQITYMRQVSYSAKRRKVMTNEMSPEDLWYCDLGAIIEEKLNEGHEIIVAGDFNDDLNDPEGRTRNFMKDLGLRELLIEEYGDGPATHIRGSATIDGVFASSGIHIDQGRYLPFERSPSDHRWIVIDIPESSLIGKARIDRLPPLSRKVTSKIPSVKEHFHSIVEQLVVRHRLYQRLQPLFNIAKEGKQLSPESTTEYERIETLMQRIIKHADRKCRKIRRGIVPYSPYQKKLMGSILILRQLKLRILLTGKPNRPKMRRIQRLIKKYNYDDTISWTDIAAVQKKLNEAISDYARFKQVAHEHRWTYLEAIAKEHSERDGKSISHHFKTLQHREQCKDHFRRIKISEGKSRGGGVDRVQIDHGDESRIVYDRKIIEKEIMRVNETKLQQAKDTPLRNRSLSALLGEQGDFQAWEEILRGTITLPEEVDESLRLWFTYITNMQHHKSTDFMWTTEEYFDSWRQISEDKTTLPGIQVAHIKCIHPESSAASVISLLALIPFMTGYSPITWRTGIDSMIPKKTADLRPEKLRLILLLDARFNHGNKLIGKKMMEYGEKHNLLAPEQYGSRKSKSAIDHATNKKFTLDILRQSKTNAIYIANDAKSCYDRIILMVAYLTMRNFGIPALVAQSTIDTIMNMKHYVRTRYGDSKTYYGGNKWKYKPHGCGQGNGYGPALWACISSPLLHVLRQEGFGE